MLTCNLDIEKKIFTKCIAYEDNIQEIPKNLNMLSVNCFKNTNNNYYTSSIGGGVEFEENFFNAQPWVFKDGVITFPSIPGCGLGDLVALEPTARCISKEVLPGIILEFSKEECVVCLLAYPSEFQLDTYTATHLYGTFFLPNPGRFYLNIDFSQILGNVVDIFGDYCGKLDCDWDDTILVETLLNGITNRQRLTRPLKTGIFIVDFAFPLGLGQRQLIIGDRATGKTALAVDAILFQRETDIRCIYVGIGLKGSVLKKVHCNFLKYCVGGFTTVIYANAADPAVFIFLVPYTACAVAEIYVSMGCDCLVVYDDLSKHAVAYRQMALLLRKAPGREAYPSDIFYLHSNLLERSGQFSNGASFSALPIVETQFGDLTAFIVTNVVSITDGQFFLDAKYFNRSIFPPIHAGLSVTRVGAKAQPLNLRKMSI